MAVLDFDSHFDQVKKEPTSIKVRGQEFVLPPDVPMSYVLLMQQEDADMEVAFFTLLASIFGETMLTEWIGGGMSRQEYVALVEMVAEHYFHEITPVNKDGEPDPKAPKSSPSS